MMQFLKNHLFVILLSVFIGILYVSPFFYFPRAVGDDYKGFFLGGSYDEEFYWSIVDQVKDGKSVDHNMYIYENRDSGISFRYHPIEFMLGQVGRFVPIDELSVLTKFLFPALLAVVVYFLFIAFGLSRLGAFVGATVVLLGNELAPLAFNQIVKTISLTGGPHSFLYYDRPVNPSVSAPFFFGLVLLIYRLFINPKISRAIVIGIGVGLMSYVYFFYWNYLLIFLGIITIFSLIYKKWDLFRPFTTVIVTSLVVSAPFILGVLHTFLFPDIDLLTVAKNYIPTHRFVVEKIVLAPLFVLVLLWFIDRRKGNTLISIPEQKPLFFVGLMLVAGFVASNQQVITGIEIQQFHYHFSTNIPVFLVTAGLLFSFLLNRLPRFPRYPLVFIVLFVFTAHAIFIQTYSYRYNFNKTIDSQRYISAFDWLNKNTDSSGVVLSNTEISELLPIYTRNYVYGALHASAFPVPAERLKHNYFTLISLHGVKKTEAKSYFYDPLNRNALGQYIFEGQYWRARCGSFGCFPDKVLDGLILEYQNFTQKPLVENIKKYKSDYIFWDLKSDTNWALDKYTFLKKTFQGEEVAIYEIENTD